MVVNCESWVITFDSQFMTHCLKWLMMREFILLVFITYVSSMFVFAQSDGYFSYQYEYREDKNNEWSELIMLPPTHGLDYNYPADEAPLGTGLLMMTGIGLAYIYHKNNKCNHRGDLYKLRVLKIFSKKNS